MSPYELATAWLEQRGRELTPSEMDAAGALLGEPLYVCTAAEMYATATWESM